MIVIQHDLTGERFMFPSHNVNKETPTGFIQFQVVPKGFSLAQDQTPVPIHYLNDSSDTYLTRWEANSKDPLKTMNRWE
jgi:hypothetical protein